MEKSACSLYGCDNSWQFLSGSGRGNGCTVGGARKQWDYGCDPGQWELCPLAPQ